jgi:hypothetical protein
MRHGISVLQGVSLRQRRKWQKPMRAQAATSCFHPYITHGGHIMLYTIAVVLIILWLLGLVTSYTIGGFIHILLVVAVIMILLRLISGRGL